MIADRKGLNEALAKRRIILLAGEITDYRAEEIMSQLMALNLESTQEIKLIINSGGGDVDPGLWIYDAMKLIAAPVTGIVVGRCASTALMVLQGCQKRVATKHSKLLCHFVRYSATFPIYNGFEKKLKARVEKAKEGQGYFEEILAERAKATREAIVKLMKEGERDGEISAKRAKELGFIDEVIEKYEEVPEATK